MFTNESVPIQRMEREQHVLKTYSLRRDLDWRLRALHSEKDAYEVLQSENKTTGKTGWHVCHMEAD